MKAYVLVYDNGEPWDDHYWYNVGVYFNPIKLLAEYTDRGYVAEYNPTDFDFMPDTIYLNMPKWQGPVDYDRVASCETYEEEEALDPNYFNNCNWDDNSFYKIEIWRAN